MILVENNNNNDLKENNIIRVTNNNVKYYENLALQHSKESAKSATKSASYANQAKEYLNSCQILKSTIDDETMQIVKLHSDNTENPHKVVASQVGAYSKTELDSLLKEELAKKNQKLVAGENVLITDNEDGSQTIKSANTVSLNYELAENKPSINNIVLNGDKSYSDLGLASIDDIPLNLSELNNDCGYLTTHQDITGKQDLISAGDGILISENVVSTVNRTDNDLSNLSDVGKKVIDGQWVAKEQVLSTAIAVGAYTVDLSDYLPNDSYNYEVMITGRLGGSGTSTNITSSLITEISGRVLTNGLYIGSCRGGQLNAYCFSIPLSAGNRSFKYKIINLTQSNVSMCAMYYRRIGTNE